MGSVAGGASADLPGRGIELGPRPGFHAVEFVGSAGEGLEGCRVIVVRPLMPFCMAPTELGPV